MSGHDDFDEDAAQRSSNAHYSSRHPIPTVQQYQSHKDERQAAADAQVPSEAVAQKPQEVENQGIFQSTKDFLHIGTPSKDATVDENHPYNSANRNIEPAADQDHDHDVTNDHRKSVENDQQGKFEQSTEELGMKDTSQAIDSALDPRQKRKNMKHMKRDHATREVTDPVTHLRVMVHDSTNKELKTVPENEPPPGSMPRTATGTSAASKNQTELNEESFDQQAQHNGMEKLFPPPEFDATRTEIASIYTLALAMGLCAILASSTAILVGSHILLHNASTKASWLNLLISSSSLFLIAIVVGGFMIWGLRGWLNIRIKSIWDDELWASARNQEVATAYSPMPESTQWLNSLLSSVWPLINPDLFTSLADTLEDVMQASLPKMVRMISVEDIGQGNESLRILGVRWLPTGAAAKNVSEDGQIKSSQRNNNSDRKVPGEGEMDDSASSTDKGDEASSEKSDASNDDEQGEEQNIAEGMEAEEGDFVNVEVAFSYRASKSGKSIKTRSKNAHLYLAFYLPGGIRFRERSPPKIGVLFSY